MSVADRLYVHGFFECPEIVFGKVMHRPHGADTVPRRPAKVRPVKDIQDRLPAHRLEVRAVRPDEVQGIPAHAVVPAADGNGAGGLVRAHGELKHRGWADAEIQHLTTGTGQACHHG